MTISRLKELFFPNGIYSGFQPSNPDDKKGFSGQTEIMEVLINAVKPRTIVEVGSWKGHSAIAMAEYCKKIGIFTDILCVDTWLGSQEHWIKDNYRASLQIHNGRPQIYDEFLSNVSNSGLQSLITPLCVPASTAAEILKKLKIKGDLIYIDAGHGYNDVMSDLNSYFPLLSKNGIIFGDDYPYSPLSNAVHDFAALNRCEIYVEGRRWIFRREGDTQPPVGVATLRETAKGQQ